MPPPYSIVSLLLSFNLYMGTVFAKGAARPSSGIMRNSSFRLQQASSSSLGFGSRSVESLQSIYDNLMSIADIKQTAAQPKSNVQIQKVMEAMNNVKLSDLGLTDAYLQREKDCVCMNVVCTDSFHVSVFILPRGKGLPLHDHPGMTVLSKLISGQLNVRSFSPISNGGGELTAFSSKPLPKVHAKLTQSSIRTTKDDAWLLTPYEDNIHEFSVSIEATGPAVVFDVLLPPYHEPERPCNYYRAVHDENTVGNSMNTKDTTMTGEVGWSLERAPDPADATLPYSIRYHGYTPILRRNNGR